MAHNLTTCTFCGVGCGLYLETSGSRVIGAYPSMSHPTNAGRICVRGWHVHEVASSPDRLRAPLLRKKGVLTECSWEEAIDFVATRLLHIRDIHGPDSIAFLVSPRSSNEEAYLIQKLARAVIGTNNVDHGTGVYCNNSINVLLEMIGVAAATNSISDLGESDVILVDQVDLFRKLPTIGGAVIRAKVNGTRLISVGMRQNRVAESADVFLQVKPDSEAVLYGAMAKVIVDRGLADRAFIRAHCDAYDDFVAQVREYDLLKSAETCGVSADSIEQAALMLAQAKSAALLFSTVEAARSESVQALVNLGLLTGNIGRTRGGLFPLAEQNNLQGVCDLGILPNRFPGYCSITDDACRDNLEALWKVKLPRTPGLGARNVLTDRGHGSVKALWLCRYNPVRSALFGEPRKTLPEFDLVVAQHPFLTADSQFATVVLPTVLFGEEEVTFTNTERRIQLAHKVVEPAAGAKPAWNQIAEVARAMGADWVYNSGADVMKEIGEAVPFYGGANYENLDQEYGRQWPCTKDRPLGTPRLFAQPNGGGQARFRFEPVGFSRQAAPENKSLTLVFGHSLYYWHQDALVQHSETLKREYNILFLDYPKGFVEINTADAKELGIRDGEMIRLVTAGGAAQATARVTPEIRAGTVFVPYFMAEVEMNIFGAAGDVDRTVPVRLEKMA
jgi:predicted molibdopterin-dependent oxidoreductase YjgC